MPFRRLKNWWRAQKKDRWKSVSVPPKPVDTSARKKSRALLERKKTKELNVETKVLNAHRTALWSAGGMQSTSFKTACQRLGVAPEKKFFELLETVLNNPSSEKAYDALHAHIWILPEVKKDKLFAKKSAQKQGRLLARAFAVIINQSLSRKIELNDQNIAALFVYALKHQKKAK